MPLETKENCLRDISFPLYPDNMNYASVIFREISIDLLINMYFAILLQSKIVIITQKIEKISLIIESMFKLIYPLDTSIYTTIGFISEGMQDFIGAPVPVIIGCHPSTFSSIPEFEIANIRNEAVIMHLDDNQYTWQGKVAFPSMHVDYCKCKLMDIMNSTRKIKDFRNDEYVQISDDSHMELAKQKMKREESLSNEREKAGLSRTGRLTHNAMKLGHSSSKIIHNISLDSSPNVKTPRRQDGVLQSIKLQVMINLEVNMKIKKVFVNLMILILNNYQDYYSSTSEGEFNFEAYVNDMPLESREFYHRFVRTQLFNTFIKDSSEELTLEIREFKNYMTIVNKSNQSSIGTGELSEKSIESESKTPKASLVYDRGPKTFRPASKRQSQNVSLELLSKNHKRLKLQALSLKQNIEILNLLKAFDDSDSDEELDESHSDSIIQVGFLEGETDKKISTENYNSATTIKNKNASSLIPQRSESYDINPIRRNEMPRKRSGFKKTGHQGGRKRCDSGKLESKGPKRGINYDSQSSLGKGSAPSRYPVNQVKTNTNFRFKKTTSSSALKNYNKVKKINSDLDWLSDTNQRLVPGINRAAKSDSVNVYETRKPFHPSSIPTVEVNVIPTERGDDNLSVTSRSIEKIPVKNIPHYNSIFENSQNHALRWSNKKNISVNSDSINEAADENEYESATLAKDEVTDKTNKPYDSSSILMCNERSSNYLEDPYEEFNEHEEEKIKDSNRCAQSIPILSMKKKQIQPLENISSVSPTKYERIIQPMSSKGNTLETPMNREKILLKQNCNSDVGLKKMYDEMISRDDNSLSKDQSMTIVKPKKNFRLKFRNFKNYGRQMVASPAQSNLKSNTSGSKKDFHHPQYINNISKKHGDNFNDSVRLNMGGYPSNKLLLSNQKNQKSYYMSKSIIKRDTALGGSRKDSRFKDMSPKLQVPKSPQYLLTKSNKMMPSDKKVVDFNSSYDCAVKNSPINRKKASPYGPKRLKKGFSIEQLKESMISKEGAKKDTRYRKAPGSNIP